jgi:4-hydroxybenzoate polyprenyltransferase
LINKLQSFLKLIRIQNLIILFLIQFLLHYFLFENQGNLEFYLLASITFLITAAGYIINDIFDVESDKINKEEVIIGNQIPSRQAIFWYYLFNSVAIVLSFYLVYCINNYYLLIIFFSSIFVLRWYSKIYKHKFIIGNFLIASLTALSIFNVLFINCFDSYFLTFVYHQLPFFILVFLLTFAREIIKDLEDIKGDKLMNSKNIASSLSLVKTKAIIVFTLLITLFLYIFWTLMWHDKEILTIYNILINFMIAFSIYKVIFSKNKKDFRFISNLLKVIMILGILFFLLLYITP